MKKKLWKYILMAGALIVILLMAMAPGVVKNYAIRNSKELTGRQISLEKLKINYFTSTFRFIDFKMFESNDQDVFVSFDTLLLNLAPLRLIRNEKVIERLYLKGLEVDVIQYDSLFNFSDLLEFHETVPDTSDNEPFQYDLSALEIAGAIFNYTDAGLNKTISTRDLNLFVPHIAWNQSDRSEAGLKFNFMREGFLESSLNIHPGEKDFDFHFAIHRLYLDPFSDYLKKQLRLDSIGGALNADFTVKGDLDEVEKIVLSGAFEILDLEITDQQKKNLAGVDRFLVSAHEIDLFSNNILIDSIKFSQPYLHFELRDSSNNLMEFLGVQAAQKGDTLEEAGPIMDKTQSDISSSLSFALNSLVIDRGIIDYTDRRTSEPFNYHLSELSLSADSITNQKEWVDINSQMLLNNRGTLKAELGLNPNKPMDINLDFVITDFLLSDLNIYSRYYTGSPILKGDMYYKSTTRIVEGVISSENKLTMERVEIGEKKGGVHDLPLKFALFLLKDREGTINLDVPVRGDLKDPEVNVGKIVWATFKNLIVKTAAAPYDLLADLLSVDPGDIEAIEFAYMDTVITDDRKKQLDLLLTLEEKKEGLGIELVYFNDISEEKMQINASLGELSETGEFETGSQVPAYPPAVDTLALEYEEMRITRLQNHLKSRNDSTRISTSRSNPESPENLGSLPKFVVKYTMKED